MKIPQAVTAILDGGVEWTLVNRRTGEKISHDDISSSDWAIEK